MDHLNYHLQRVPSLLPQEIKKRHYTLIDARSPEEYAKGSIPSCINISVFDNFERAEIGYIYKHIGTEQAVTAGYDFIRQKLELLQQQFANIPHIPVIIFCARGGYRSRAITALLTEWGFQAFQLDGGYKAYRQETLECLNQIKFQRLWVLQGQTGTGKTLLLQQLENTLDLEACAGHRGSVFGRIGCQPRTQKWFEAFLYEELQQLNLHRPIYIEAESRKIGAVEIPKNIFQQMQTSSYKVLLEARQETRIQRTLETYSMLTQEDEDVLKNGLDAIKARMSTSDKESIMESFRENDHFALIQKLFENYYDPLYNRKLSQGKYRFSLDTENLEQATKKLKERVKFSG